MKITFLRLSTLLIALVVINIQYSFSQSYRVEIYAIGAACNPGEGNSDLDLDITFNGENFGYTFTTHVSSRVNLMDKEYTSIPLGLLRIVSRSVCMDCPDGRDSCELFTDSYTNNQTLDLSGTTACTTVNIPIPIDYGSLRLEVKWTPTYVPPNSNQLTQSGIDLCEGEELTLTTGSGFTDYIWQYKDAGMSAFQPFFTNPGNESSITVGLEDIYGSSYQNKLGNANSIQFEYSLGTCPKVITTAPVHFFPKAPQVQAENIGFTKTNPSCYGGKGSVNVILLNRNILSGETINIKIFNQSDNIVGGIPIKQATNISTLPVSFSDLSPGNYKFFIESLQYQCGDVNNPLVMNFSITEPSQVSFSSFSTAPSCHANTTGVKNNGTIIIDADGGTGGGYKYSIEGGSFQVAGVNPFTIMELPTDSYTIVVRDANDCPSSSHDVAVNQPSDITLSSAVVSSDYNGKDIRCLAGSDGQITVTASGGTGTSLEYSIGGIFVNGNTPTGHVFNGLGEGSYTIIVEDDNDCRKSFSSAVPLDAPDAVTGSVTPVSATCNGQPSGSITVSSAAGGTPGYMYSINGTDFQLSSAFIGLLSNTYTVAIRDANLCTTTINTSVGQPLAIGVSSTPTIVTCAGGNDGSVQITATNTTGTPQYSLNGSAFQTSNTFTGLAANTYSVIVRDGNNCIGTGSTTFTSNPIITGPITISTPISCNGGSNGVLNLTPGGGVGPYTFIWSNGAITEDITNLSANAYSVTVKDNANCTQTFNRLLTEPLPITISTNSSNYNGTNISCFGGNNGTINITPAGGNGGYTYLWSNGSSIQNQSNLTAGMYSVTVTDNKSCTGNQNITLTQPGQLTTTISNATNIGCFGGNTGSITVNTTGGTTDYEYSINNGTNWQSTPTFANLTTNSYTILTRDENNCADTDNTTLTSPDDLVLTVDNITSTTCNQNNGGAEVSATGGVSNYNFSWLNSGNTQVGTGTSINNLTAGVYRLVVTDQNSCSKQQNVTISSSNGPSVTVQTVTPASCSNTTDGTATINITQGQAPYTILWPNNQTTATATNLSGGDYIVEVRDNTNCLALHTVTVPAPRPLTIHTITQKDPNCSGNSDGTLTVQAQGGNGSYLFNWNTGSTNSTITNLTAGTYTVTMSDNKNCQAIQQYTLVNPPLFIIDVGADEKICEGQTIAKTLNVTNGVYNWTGPNNFASTQSQISISQPGIYAVTVTNEKGCEDTDSFELTIDSDLLKADFLMVSEAYSGDTIIVIDISWPIPTTTNWEFDQNAVIIDESPDYSLIRFDEPGTYTTTLEAQLAQCISTYNQNIIIVENPDQGGKTHGKKGERIIKTVHVYPNPAHEKIKIEVELTALNETQISLYHLHDNRLEYSKTFTDNTIYETEIKLENLETGLYVIVVKTRNEIKSVKVIKL